MSTWSRLSWLLLLGSLLPGAALSQEGGASASDPASSAVVWCLDRERDVVRRDLPSQCHGSIVSDAEARAVKARREEAIAHALAPKADNGVQGLNFASLGTAFYVDEAGDLITNDHVVANCRVVQVRSLEQPPVSATVLAVDQMHDLALLHAGPSSPGYATFRSGVHAGISSNVSTVGYPDEGLPALEPQASQGKLLRGDDGAGHMLIDMDVRHGNSGSPLLDTGGLVIGVIRAKVNSPAVYARTGHEVDDTGVAIPTSSVLEFLAHNHIHFYASNGAPSEDQHGLLSAARKFVARAECWK